MTTDADKHLTLARENLDEAISNLSAIVIAECSGTEDFLPEYRERMEEAFLKLREAKRVLRW